ncbi:MAG: hypothetical protein HKN00_04555 [Flavobacteriaceae bacterium]|nr:hypothetical protein [Bacteroidia bacterium]MBT8287950.1 hypothetical protein [Bacteroidia bacterium]NNF74433.1 hypothetical protein [Flavobacteriaceae bacterium]NNK73648.1 hypothetical protein [Flavobacteriaceae bacterium]RZW39078.1 MAG: hypothetical protein EX263_13775 [Flavobacteriaceae bacterium]
MVTAVFKSFKKGYYTFEFENGEDMVFEQVHPKVLSRLKLNENDGLIGTAFKLAYSEIYEDDDDDSVIYRIEQLHIIE